MARVTVDRYLKPLGKGAFFLLHSFSGKNPSPMKTISISLILLACVSFRPITESTAIPRKIQGIDVYVMSEPSRPYEIIENKTQAFKALTCDSYVNVPIKAAAKIEGAQGVILYWPDGQKYSVIKYKD